MSYIRSQIWKLWLTKRSVNERFLLLWSTSFVEKTPRLAFKNCKAWTRPLNFAEKCLKLESRLIPAGLYKEIIPVNWNNDSLLIFLWLRLILSRSYVYVHINKFCFVLVGFVGQSFILPRHKIRFLRFFQRQKRSQRYGLWDIVPDQKASQRHVFGYKSGQLFCLLFAEMDDKSIMISFHDLRWLLLLQVWFKKKKKMNVSILACDVSNEAWANVMWAIKENPNKIVFVSFSTFLGPHDSLKSF